MTNENNRRISLKRSWILRKLFQKGLQTQELGQSNLYITIENLKQICSNYFIPKDLQEIINKMKNQKYITLLNVQPGSELYNQNRAKIKLDPFVIEYLEDIIKKSILL